MTSKQKSAYLMLRSFVYVKYTNVITINIPSIRPMTTALVELKACGSEKLSVTARSLKINLEELFSPCQGNYCE